MSSHFHILCFMTITLVRAAENCESLVDYYEEWYEKRTGEALKYELPTDARMYKPENEIQKEYGEYDFIIVGGGTTGSVIACRLAENYKWKILILEAGVHRDEEFTDVPAWRVLNTFSKYSWGYESIPQETTFLGNKERKCLLTNGKGFGGSSLLNSLIYSRGNKLDYERWAALLNDPSWNYDNLLPYFKKSEKFSQTRPYVQIDSSYHGCGGPHPTTHVVPAQNMSANILKGAEQLGYNITDYNGEQQLGASILQYNIKKGRRVDNAIAFLLTAKQKRNLEILDSSYVIKIELNKQTKQVIGVIFTRKNNTYIARARKEVILSAGAISSPNILMLSGIGPKDHLKALGIPVLQNLPVGRTLYDHPSTILVFSSNVTIPGNLEQSIRDLLIGQGELTHSPLCDAVCFFKTHIEPVKNFPDIELMFNNVSGSTLVQNFLRYSDKTYKALFENASNVFTIQMVVLRPKWPGTLKLKSFSPYDYPLIDLNIFSDKNNTDIETLYQGVKIVQRLLETKAFKSMSVSFAVPKIPGCNNLEPMNREYWYCYFKRVTALVHHQMSTCLMGTTPETAVVDKELRVFGIKGLRVADASIIPFPITGHLNAPCTMVGEKVSDLIRHHY